MYSICKIYVNTKYTRKCYSGAKSPVHLPYIDSTSMLREERKGRSQGKERRNKEGRVWHIVFPKGRYYSISQPIYRVIFIKRNSLFLYPCLPSWLINQVSVEETL